MSYIELSQTTYRHCTLVVMESFKSIASLSWRSISCSLSEVFDKYKVPNLVRIDEGHYGQNDACSFDVDQILMLHTMRKKQEFIGKDSVGRPIAIPEECETKLLVCPSSTYCKYDPIYVCEMPKFYPDIKYFRVTENAQNEGIEGYFKQGSIAQIEYIDAENLEVKFKDVKEPLPFNCSIVFEALLDYRVYTLENAVREFGLPIKVTSFSKICRKVQSQDHIEIQMNLFQSSSNGPSNLTHRFQALQYAIAIEYILLDMQQTILNF